MLHRAARETLRWVRGAIWLTAGLVGVADGSNDGQKAMGLATALLVAAGTIHSFAVPFWVTALVALVLATGTAAGGRRVVRTVSSRLYRGGPLDGLAAQGASAVAILGAASLGAPVSSSTVLASSMIGVSTGLPYAPWYPHGSSPCPPAHCWALAWLSLGGSRERCGEQASRQLASDAGAEDGERLVAAYLPAGRA
jgi:hypothetical protein